MTAWLAAGIRLKDQTGVGAASAIANIKAVERTYNRSQGSMNRMATVATGGFGKLNASYAATVGQLSRLGAVGTGAAAAIGLTTVAAAKAYREYRKLREEIKKAAGIAGGEIKTVTAILERQAKDIAVKWATPLQQTAWATYQALSGAVPFSNLENFMDATGRFVRAEFLADFATGVDLLTTVTNSYGEAASNTGQIVDVLSETIKYGKVTAQQMAETMSTVTPMAGSLGVSLEQVSAGIAAMTAQGVNAAESTTYIRRFLIEVSDTSSEAHEHFKRITQQTFAEYIAAGNTLSDVANEYRMDAEAQGRSIDEYFGRVQASQAALVLSSEAGMRRYQQTFDALSNSFGAAARKAWANMDEGYFVLDALGTKISTVWAGMGAGVSDAVGALFGWTVQSADTRYASDLLTQALQDESSEVKQLALQWEKLETHLDTVEQQADLTAEAIRQLVENLSIPESATTLMQVLAMFDQTGRTVARDAGVPAGHPDYGKVYESTHSIVDMLTGSGGFGRGVRDRAWEVIEAELGQEFSDEMKRVVQEAAKAAKDQVERTARQAEADAIRAGANMENLTEQVLSVFRREGMEPALDLLGVALEDVMRVVKNRGVDIAHAVIRGFIETGPGSGLPGTPHPGLMNQAGAQFMVPYTQHLYRNRPDVQSAMAHGMAGLDALTTPFDWISANYARHMSTQPGGVWYEPPSDAGRVASETMTELDRLKESIIGTREEFENVAEFLPSYEAALGEMHGETAELARAAAVLGVSFEDLTDAEQDALLAIDRTTDARHAEQQAIEALEAAVRHAASELGRVQSVSSGYNFDPSTGSVTGRMTRSETLQRQIDADQAKYGGINYDLDRLNRKLAEGRHKPDQVFKSGEFAGFTLQEAIDFTESRQRAVEVQKYEAQQEADAREAERLRREQAEAERLRREQAEAARQTEADRVRSISVMRNRFGRGDVTGAALLDFLEQQRQLQESRFGRFSPEEQAIYDMKQAVVEQLEDLQDAFENKLDEFLHLLVGAQVTSATAGWDRSYQTVAGTRAVALDEHRRIREVVYG